MPGRLIETPPTEPPEVILWNDWNRLHWERQQVEDRIRQQRLHRPWEMMDIVAAPGFSLEQVNTLFVGFRASQGSSLELDEVYLYRYRGLERSRTQNGNELHRIKETVERQITASMIAFRLYAGVFNHGLPPLADFRKLPSYLKSTVYFEEDRLDGSITWSCLDRLGLHEEIEVPNGITTEVIKRHLREVAGQWNNPQNPFKDDFLYEIFNDGDQDVYENIFSEEAFSSRSLDVNWEIVARFGDAVKLLWRLFEISEPPSRSPSGSSLIEDERAHAMSGTSFSLEHPVFLSPRQSKAYKMHLTASIV